MRQLSFFPFFLSCAGSSSFSSSSSSCYREFFCVISRVFLVGRSLTFRKRKRRGRGSEKNPSLFLSSSLIGSSGSSSTLPFLHHPPSFFLCSLHCSCSSFSLTPSSLLSREQRRKREKNEIGRSIDRSIRRERKKERSIVAIFCLSLYLSRVLSWSLFLLSVSLSFRFFR